MLLILVNLLCTFCGRNGHTIDYCYQKYGFPPHFQRNSKVGSSTNHHASTYNVGENVDFSSQPEAVQSSPTITTEQYENLMLLLHNSCITHDSVPAHASSNQVSSFYSIDHPSDGKQGTSFVSSLPCHSFSLNSWIIDSGLSLTSLCISIQTPNTPHQISLTTQSPSTTTPIPFHSVFTTSKSHSNQFTFSLSKFQNPNSKTLLSPNKGVYPSSKVNF